MTLINNKSIILLIFLFIFIINISYSFKLSSSTSSIQRTRLYLSATVEKSDIEKKYTQIPGLSNIIRPSIQDKARTITHVCASGTLCTISAMEGDVSGQPFGSYVDYILDENGWPVLLLSEQSIHTVNIKKNSMVSLFCQLPRSVNNQAAAALSRVTLMGSIVDTSTEELSALKLAFTLAHPYAEQIVDSPKFSFCKIKPSKIYFSGGFGVMATWVDVNDYEQARPDVLAQEVATMLSKINLEKQGELFLLAKNFLGLENIDNVRLQAIDRLGVDLRISSGDFTDEYRIGFRHKVSSAEDAKSELMKLFQESWERDQGIFYNDKLPPFTKYAEDILREQKK